MSVDTLHKQMLDDIPNNYQKTVGFPTYDLTRAFAIGAAELEDAIQQEACKLDVDNLVGDELTRFCRQYRNIIRRAATYAQGALTVTGSGTVPKGALFATEGGVQFVATDTVKIVGSGSVPVQAVLPGPAGNVPQGTVTQIPVTIQGIVSVTNPDDMTGGYDEEDDDMLRARYYLDIQQPSTSANRADYRQWALEIAGVGAVKTFPLAQGNWTVDVVIVNDKHQPADEDLVAAVQAHIDPGSTGLGDGRTAIGAHCYVSSATAQTITVAATLTLSDPDTLEAVKAAVTEALTAYLYALPFADKQTAVVSYAQVGALLLDIPGVIDYTGLLLGGGTANIQIGDRAVAVLGEVSLDVAG